MLKSSLVFPLLLFNSSLILYLYGPEKCLFCFDWLNSGYFLFNCFSFLPFPTPTFTLAFAFCSPFLSYAVSLESLATHGAIFQTHLCSFSLSSFFQLLIAMRNELAIFFVSRFSFQLYIGGKWLLGHRHSTFHPQHQQQPGRPRKVREFDI